jgi:hypothetical protein
MPCRRTFAAVILTNLCEANCGRERVALFDSPLPLGEAGRRPGEGA